MKINCQHLEIKCGVDKYLHLICMTRCSSTWLRIKRVKPLIFKEKPASSAPKPSGTNLPAVTTQGGIKQISCNTPEVDKLGSLLEYCEMNAGGK